MIRSVRPWHLGASMMTVLALLWAGPSLLGTPKVVAEVSVVNRSDFDVHVDVTDEGRDGWVSLTTANKASTTVAEDVVDQGDVWVFRFQAQGREGGELPLGRDDLDRSGWTVEVPAAVIEQLRRLGTPPTP